MIWPFRRKKPQELPPAPEQNFPRFVLEVAVDRLIVTLELPPGMGSWTPAGRDLAADNLAVVASMCSGNPHLFNETREAIIRDSAMFGEGNWGKAVIDRLDKATSNTRRPLISPSRAFNGGDD